MPLEWDELTDELSIRDFTMHNALDRLTRKGDIFLPVLHGRTDLNIALSRLQDSQ
jgi:bifunctional non-homologous end joining protein LigD